MPPFKIPFPQTPGPQATNIAGPDASPGPTDNPDIWEALRPMLMQAMQGITQERGPAESLYFPTQNRRGEQTFFGRHPKIRRSLEMGLHQFAQPLPPNAPGEAYLARGLGVLSSYDQARKDKAYESSNERFARLDPLLAMAERVQRGELASAQTAHFESLADRPQPFQVGAPGTSVIRRGTGGEPQFTEIPGGDAGADGQFGSSLTGMAADLRMQMQSDDPEIASAATQQYRAIVGASQDLGEVRAFGGASGRQGAGGLSQSQRDWGARQRNAFKAESKRYGTGPASSMAGGGAVAAQKLSRKHGLDRDEATALFAHVVEQRKIEFDSFYDENIGRARGSWNAHWKRIEQGIIQEFLDGGADSGGVNVGDIITLPDGSKGRIIAIDPNDPELFDYEPVTGNR